MKSRLLKSLIVLLLTISFTSIRSSGQWVQKSNGLEGGPVSSFLSDGSKLFAGSFAGVYRSDNNGVSWIAVNNGLPPIEGRYLAGSATNLFVGTQAGVFRSVDSGEHWTKASTGITQPIRSLLTKGNKVFAGTTSGIYVSDNNGTSWTPINNGLPTNADVRFVSSDGSTIFLSTTLGVYESANDGASWQIVGSTLLGTFPTVLKGNVLFAAAGGQVFKSEKVAASWSAWEPVSNGLSVSTAPSLILNGNALIVGTSKGIYESTDEGSSWHPINNGIPENISVWSLAVKAGNLFAGTMRGIYFSENGGSSWTERNTQLTNPQVSCLVEIGNTLFAGTDCGIFKSANGGDTWSRSAEGISGFGLYTRALATDGAFVYAGTQNGVYRTSDNGDTWEAANSGIPVGGRLVNALLENDGAMFVGVHLGGTSGVEVIFKSTNNGASWTPASGGLPVNFGTNALGVANGILFAAIDGSIYSSSNGGDNWTVVRPGFGLTTINFIEFDGSNLYAPLTTASLYRSPDNGVTWTQITTPASGIQARTLEPVGENLFLGTNASKEVVYMSTDQGTSWIPAGVGLPLTINYVLYATTDRLYGGFQGDKGIWSRPWSDFTTLLSSFTPMSGQVGTTVTVSGNNFDDDPTGNVVQFNGAAATVTASSATSITVTVPPGATTGKISITANGQTVTSSADFTVEETITAVEPYGEREVVVYPNPTRDIVRIDFQNVPDGPAPVGVYNSAGAPIKVIQKYEGSEIVLDISTLAPGAYFIEVVDRGKFHHRRLIKL